MSLASSEIQVTGRIQYRDEFVRPNSARGPSGMWASKSPPVLMKICLIPPHFYH